MDKENNLRRSKRKAVTQAGAGKSPSKSKRTNNQRKEEQRQQKTTSRANVPVKAEKLYLTKNAISDMARGVPFTRPYIVSVDELSDRDDRLSTKYTDCIIHDASYFVSVLLPLSLMNEAIVEVSRRDGTLEDKNIYFVARIRGYVTSEHNLIDGSRVTDPFIYITAWDFLVLEEPPGNWKPHPISWGATEKCLITADQRTRRREQPCDTSVLKRHIDLLNWEDLAGYNRHVISHSSFDQDIQKEFVRNRQLLKNFSWHSRCDESQAFSAAVEEAKEDASRANSLNVKGCPEQELLQSCGFFTKENVLDCTFHINMQLWADIVCDGALDRDSRRAKAACHIQDHWTTIFEKIVNLDEPQCCREEAGLLYACMVQFGMTEACPFEDTSLFTYWLRYGMLAHFGFPLYPDIIGDTPEDALNYKVALWKTKRNLNLVFRGEDCSNKGHLLGDALVAAGMFYPLVFLLLQRTIKLTDKVQCLYRKNLHNAMIHEVGDLAIREARADAAAGNCLICLDCDPNVSTLCCGKAAHWDCLNGWLKNHESCPQCRSSMSRKLQPEEEPATDDEDDDDMEDEMIGRMSFIIEALLSRMGENRPSVRATRITESNGLREEDASNNVDGTETTNPVSVRPAALRRALYSMEQDGIFSRL